MTSVSSRTRPARITSSRRGTRGGDALLLLEGLHGVCVVGREESLRRAARTHRRSNLLALPLEVSCLELPSSALVTPRCTAAIGCALAPAGLHGLQLLVARSLRPQVIVVDELVQRHRRCHARACRTIAARGVPGERIDGGEELHGTSAARPQLDTERRLTALFKRERHERVLT